MICDARRKLYFERCRKFQNRLVALILGESVNLEAQVAPSKDPVPFSKRLELPFKPIREGEVWGGAWDSAWFKLAGTVPAAWAGKRVVAQVELNGEGLVFSDDGLPLQGLTNGSVFTRETARELFPLFESAKGGETVSLWVEAAANGLFGINKEADPPRNCPTRHGNYTGKVNAIRLRVLNPLLHRLWLETGFLLNLYEALDPNTTRAIRILRGLNDVIDLYKDDPANATACLERYKPLLAQRANASATTIVAVGHAHIDTGWLWPVRETIRKSARTFATQLDLMERYPDYVFGASQPQHYAMVKENYPALYEKIRQAVKTGRWELQGGMWVEADCNLISGESMVRQYLHGKNFFRDEFGVDVKNTWIPDVFGYSASMPQIMQRCGIQYFLTQKLSWSQFNKFPYTTFHWRGIDGTSVLTHFPPENTYNSSLDPAGMINSEKNFKEKEVLGEMMCLFGIGDGGGGPQAEMIERGRIQKDLEGVPRVKFGRADDFFERLGKFAGEIPSWSGELYLELHRGTLTTQARTKRGNRLLEQKLRETEYLLSCGALADYPRAALDRLWKILLLNQFHDILPGSSIREVYEVTEKEHAEALAECQAIQTAAAVRICAKDPQSLTLVNTLNTAYTQPVVLPEGWSALEGVATQKEADGTVVAAVALPPQGMITLTRSSKVQEAKAATGLVLENDLIRYEFAPNGEILRAFDKEAGRECLSGPGNVFTLYEDRPNRWDAWDIDIFYENQALDNARAIRHFPLGSGPVRQGLGFELGIGQSTIRQKVTLARDSKRLEFRTEVDWNERHRMLRVAFPTTIRADQASFDIQYGFVRRNTHRNLSWEMARFEVAAHQYADLSDNAYGVALLNDCKYGHKVLENVIDLNLLRSPTHPDPDADVGKQEFTYTLLPHKGTLIESDVMSEAAQLNQPPILLAGCKPGTSALPATVTGKGVDLSVLKKAEKAECWTVRLVERRGCDTVATVTLADPKAKLVETDMMEWNDLADLGKGTIQIPMKPFEIRTFKITGVR